MSTETITAFQQGIITQPTSTLQQLPFDATDVSENGWENSQEDTTGMDISLSYLFDNAGDYKYIFPAYSADDQSGAPWGFRHQGLDLITATSARVLTPANGLVQQVEVYLNPVNNLWQVNIHIKYDDHYSYNLMFEPRAAKSEQIALQRAAILVEENDRVTEGDTLGTILNLSSEESGFGDVTVHFDLWMDGQNVCPEPYFKPEVLTTMLALLNAKYPDGQLCYP
jgi:murein DD-endopeptidase MepM/ murein hydrolase activator NlpD